MYYKFREINEILIKDTYLEQYTEAKKSCIDGVLLFQIGAFYEAYFEDAKILSDLTGITLTKKYISKLGEFISAGFAVQNLYGYLKTFLDNGLNVYLCEEIRESKDSSELIKRTITRKFTPGTIVEKELLDCSENNYILALYYKNNLCEISYADTSTGQFYKTKGTLAQTKFEIEKINPKEILICKNQEKTFKNIIQDYLTIHLEEDFFINREIDEVIVDYCILNQKNYFAKLSKISSYKIEQYLTMDSLTRTNLELKRTKLQQKKKGSLLWFLNYTKTSMGIRLLKKIIDEPLLDIKKIKERQNTISELLKTEGLLEEFENALENLCDLSRITTKIINSTIFPKELLVLFSCSNNVIKLNNLTEKTKSKLLLMDKNKVKKVVFLANEINRAISKDAPNNHKDGYIINKNYNAELDYLKEKLNECLNKIDKYEQKLINEFNIPNLKIGKSNLIGYYIEVPKGKTSQLGNEFIIKQTISTCSRYTTPALQTNEQEINSLKFKIYEIEEEIYKKIKNYAKKYSQTIRELSKDIAYIDVFVSLAKCAKINNLSKPAFNENHIGIKNGFHPSLIKLNNEVVKNDTDLKNNSMIILTGANMSGKSTYLKFNAIVPILAQIGSFVPAQKSDLTIVDKVFLRQGSTDDIINNNSSFMVEMNDLKFILDNATNNSLILLDEPAKSTNTKESGAIVKAFLEYLIRNFKAKTIVVTHNSDLTTLEEKYPQIVFNYAIGNDNSYIINDRKIRRGIMKTSSAINTAILADLPQEIISKAKKYLEEII